MVDLVKIGEQVKGYFLSNIYTMTTINKQKSDKVSVINRINANLAKSVVLQRKDGNIYISARVIVTCDEYLSPSLYNIVERKRSDCFYHTTVSVFEEQYSEGYDTRVCDEFIYNRCLYCISVLDETIRSGSLHRK